MRPVRIVRLQLKNVGVFDDALLEFPKPVGNGELVLFEGPNGSGKTTLVEAIASLIGRHPSGVCTTDAPLIRRFPGKAGSVTVTVEHHASEMNVGVLQRAAQSQKHLISWDLPDTAPVARAISSYLFSDRSEPTSSKPEWAAFMYAAHRWTSYAPADGVRQSTTQAVPGALAAAQSPQEGSRYSAGGEILQVAVNLENRRAVNRQYSREKPDPALHTAIADASEEALNRLQDALAQVLDRNIKVDFFDDAKSARILLDGLPIPPEEWGEGMRSTLSWLTDLLVRLERIRWSRNDISPWEQEFWLLLDEIEESLHPKRQMEILPAIRKLFPNAHIYATTHSPFVVASIGEGHVFSIRPDKKTGRVSGPVHAIELKHGQSLEWIVNQVFDAPSGFIDKKTIEELDAHKHDVIALRSGRSVDWQAFLLRRNWLVGLNDEVATTVLMREVSVRKIIDAELDKRRQ